MEAGASQEEAGEEGVLAVLRDHFSSVVRPVTDVGPTQIEHNVALPTVPNFRPFKQSDHSWI